MAKKGFYRVSNNATASMIEANRNHKKSIPIESFGLYSYLCYLRNAYANKETGEFYHRREEILADLSISKTPYYRARKYLVDNGFIKAWENYLVIDGKRSDHQYTFFKIIK